MFIEKLIKVLNIIVYMDEFKWRKHVTWDNPEEIEAKYEELSLKIDNVLKPLTISEIQTTKQQKTLEKMMTSGENLRTELDLLTKQQPRTPSRSLQKKHEKLVFEMKDMQSQCGDLAWTDVITNTDVRMFLEQYFPNSVTIATVDFLAFLEFEFPQYMNSESVKDELVHMLTVENKPNSISLNALELLTRDSGLERFMKMIFNRVDESIKENKAQINEEILQHVTEIKEMLDKKSAELDKRESKLSIREHKLDRLESVILTETKEKLEKTANSIKEKLTKEINLQMKRMQGLERNISDMIKLARSKQQTLTRSELSMKNSGGDSGFNKYKARISSLEKSNECMKTKLSLLELETKADKQTIAKLTDEISRIKARSSMLEQSLSAKSKPEPEKPIEVPVIKEEPIKETIKIIAETELIFSLITTLLNCCKITLPVLHGPPSPKSTSNKLSILEDSDSSLGEIFFPAFNILVPGLIECVPYIYKLKAKNEQVILLKFL